MYGKKKLTREVLYGLALGALTTGVTGACLPGQAAAMTLTEYKQALQEGRAFDVPTQSRQMKVVTTSDLASTQEKPKIMRASGENWGGDSSRESEEYGAGGDSDDRCRYPDGYSEALGRR